MEKIEFSLVIAQVVVLIVSSVIATLQKFALGQEKVDRGSALLRASEALAKATMTETEVLNFRTKRYDELVSELQDCHRKHIKLQNEIDGCKESQQVMFAKLASRAAAETKAARRQEKAGGEKVMPEDEYGFPKEPDNLDDLIKAGTAIPLSNIGMVPHATPEIARPGFGQVAKPRG